MIIAPFVLWQTSNLARYYALSSLHDQNKQTLKLIAANLTGELARFRDLPVLLATVNKDVQEYLLSARTAGQTREINILLEDINNRAGSSDIYIMSIDGITLAASNWASTKTFIGKNFYYRPYFKQAMEGKLGKYFALGNTSKLRGYYFSSPIRQYGEIIGVIVVKIKLEFFEANWQSPHHELIVRDNDGVIFLTTRPEWLYHTLFKLSASDRVRVRNSQKYSDNPIAPLNVINSNTVPKLGKILSIKHISTQGAAPKRDALGMDNSVTEYLMQSEGMNAAEWTISILAKTGPALRNQTIAIIISAFIILSVIFMAAYAAERRRRIQQGIAIQENERKLLEERVNERTADLDKSNQRLRREIAERELAEAELRQTQKELVQTGRLAAIGKLSAGISHELNQPLTAIRSYADNARAYLEHANQDAVSSNLTNISELIDRMGRIVKNLKTYAAQDTKDLRPTYLAPALDEALNLLGQRIEKMRVRVVCDEFDERVQVVAGSLRLQQIFVNLISNALDAMEVTPVKLLHIRVRHTAKEVYISIRDTGTGVKEDDLSQLFDPFFTTKEVGEGLGLGLSITYGIVKQFGGFIYVENHPEGGAVFHIRLVRSI